jgi:hypothetical protein
MNRLSYWRSRIYQRNYNETAMAVTYSYALGLASTVTWPPCTRYLDTAVIKARKERKIRQSSLPANKEDVQDKRVKALSLKDRDLLHEVWQEIEFLQKAFNDCNSDKAHTMSKLRQATVSRLRRNLSLASSSFYSVIFKIDITLQILHQFQNKYSQRLNNF